MHLSLKKCIVQVRFQGVHSCLTSHTSYCYMARPPIFVTLLMSLISCSHANIEPATD